MFWKTLASRHARIVLLLSTIMIAVGMASGCAVVRGSATNADAFIQSVAADDLARALGVQARRVELSQDRIRQLARNAEVSDDVVRSTADDLGTSALFQSARNQTSRIRETYGPPAAQVALGVACDGLTGEIQTYGDVYTSLTNNLVGLTTPQAQALTEDTVELYGNLYNSLAQGNQYDRAAVHLACYSAQQLSG